MQKLIFFHKNGIYALEHLKLKIASFNL